MANTPAQAIPYAGPNDAPDVPYWSQRQAERVAALFDGKDAQLAKLPVQFASGSDSITMAANLATVTKTISLPAGFATAPFITLQNMSNPAGRALQLQLYVNSPTKDNFVVRMSTGDGAVVGTSYSIVFNWQASL